MSSKALSLTVILSFLFMSAFIAPAFPKDMVEISGEYGASAGFQTDSFIWKEANENYQEKNWRYIWGPDTVNTYDPRIFDRYELEIKTNTGTPWNGYAEVVIDPWTFLGKATQTVRNARLPANRDEVEVEYKYWEATGKTINETYRTNRGYVVDLPELKVIGDQVSAYSQIPTNVIVGGAASSLNFSRGREVKIDRYWRPVRNLWVDYDDSPLFFRLFPFAEQEQAMTSDDPLGLVNHHIYWMPSPWLYNFDLGQTFNYQIGTRPVYESRWDHTTSFYAQDSNHNFLTLLRGARASYKVRDVAQLDFSIASPLSPWDLYEDVDSIPAAARLKITPNDKIELGTVYTSKMGIHRGAIRANNNVGAVDGKYLIAENTHISGQFGGSYSDYQYSNEVKQGYYGLVYQVGVDSKANVDNHKFFWDANFTSMSSRFQPGLADYRDTRNDMDWGRHIWFDPIPQEDAAIRIGDSIDTNRNVVGANFKANIFDNLADLYCNFRNAHNAYNGKFIENIVRVETTINPMPHVQFKGLYLQRNYPLTTGGLDPFLKDRFTDLPWMNWNIVDGVNADLYTYSAGVKVDMYDEKLTLFGIFEATNDPQDFPRKEQSNLAFTPLAPLQAVADDTDGWISDSNLLFDRLVPQLYSQDFYGMPLFDFYNIWKGVVIARPVDRIIIRYTHVTNGNRNYAPLLDDNHNHDAIDITYVVFKNLVIQAGYSCSRIINLNRNIDTVGADRKFEAHHNVYAQAHYQMKRDHSLIVQFGEYGLLQENLGIFGMKDEGMGYLKSRQGVLDTRSIVRLFYQGKF